MTTAAKNTFGNVFKAVASGGSPATIGEQASVKPPTLARGMQDATVLDQASQAMESIPEGVYDPGTMSVSYQAIDQNTSDALFYGALTAGTLLDCQLVTKKAAGGGTWSFSAYVTSYDPGEFNPRGKQMVTVQLKLTGAITRA